MNATRKRLKKKALQQTLDDIVKGILDEHKGNDKQIVLALITANKDLKDAGANPKELKKFQDKIEEQMNILRVKKQHAQKMTANLKQVELGVKPGVEFVDPGDGGGDLININFGKKSKKGGRKTRRRRKKKGKRNTKRRRKTKRKRKKKKRKTKRRSRKGGWSAEKEERLGDLENTFGELWDEYNDIYIMGLQQMSLNNLVRLPEFYEYRAVATNNADIFIPVIAASRQGILSPFDTAELRQRSEAAINGLMTDDMKELVELRREQREMIAELKRVDIRRVHQVEKGNKQRRTKKKNKQ